MISDNTTPMYMPVAPAYGGGYGGGFGGDGLWWVILFFAMMGGGWGGGFGGGGYDFPWLLAGQNQINANTNSGFDHAATQSTLGNIQTAITGGFGDMATQLCGGFAGVNAAINGAANSLSQQLNTNEIASLNRSFAEQTANMQGFAGLQAQLAQCCCDNRLATCQTQNLVATDGAATRATIQSAVQTVLDRMCQDKIDAKNELIVGLNNKINALESNNYIQNALTAQTQYFLSLFPPPAAAARAAS